MPDRRQASRFAVSEGVFAQFDAECEKLGQVKDISMDGLSLRYVKDDLCISARGKLKLIIIGSGLYLEGVGVETISDIEIAGGFSISPLKMHRAGLRFTDLSTEQKNKIRSFIDEHTIGEQS